VDEETRSIIIFQTDGDQWQALRDQPDAERYFSEYGRSEFGLVDIYAAAERSNATVYSVITNGRMIGLPPDQIYKNAKESLTRAKAVFRPIRLSQNPWTTVFDEEIKLWIKMRAPGQTAMERVASLTGGMTLFLDRPEQATDIYSKILAD